MERFVIFESILDVILEIPRKKYMFIVSWFVLLYMDYFPIFTYTCDL